MLDGGNRKSTQSRQRYGPSAHHSTSQLQSPPVGLSALRRGPEGTVYVLREFRGVVQMREVSAGRQTQTTPCQRVSGDPAWDWESSDLLHEAELVQEPPELGDLVAGHA